MLLRYRLYAWKNRENPYVNNLKDYCKHWHLSTMFTLSPKKEQVVGGLKGGTGEGSRAQMLLIVRAKK